MRIMVTGANAPLGQAIVAALAREPDVELVLAISNERAVAPDGPRVIHRAVDLTCRRALHDLVWGAARAHAIDRVFHGIQHRDDRDAGPAVHRQNVEATHELLLACAAHPTIRRLVYRSHAEIYLHGPRTPDVIDEDEPLDFSPARPQWIRDRVEADLDVCAHFGGALELAVLRFAEILAPATGSHLWRYLQARVCVRPLGYDPMINVLSLDDAVAAAIAALRSHATGVFNIPGRDTLPLSEALVESQRMTVVVPVRSLHVGGVVDGARARAALGYTPKTPVRWPRPWWQVLAAQLAETHDLREPTR